MIRTSLYFRISILATVACRSRLVRRFYGVTQADGITLKAPAQTELRPTCAGAAPDHRASHFRVGHLLSCDAVAVAATRENPVRAKPH
jgi:hypothetical protein